MKKILGLDLGTTSIGWAVVNEAENDAEQSSIVRLGVRVNPLTVDEQTNFEKGKPITTNADRALKKGMRRNLQRYKLRRQHLIDALLKYGLVTDDSQLCETSNAQTFETYRLRARAATEPITSDQLARVLLMINKKRGYKSNRKAKSDDDGQLIDGMEVARRLYADGLTPGQYALAQLRSGKKYVPDFYQSDLRSELMRIWRVQSAYYPDILTDELLAQVDGRNRKATAVLFLAKHGIYTADVSGKDKRELSLVWRTAALDERLEIEKVAYVVADINAQIAGSSGLLGRISDRSKELYFGQMTVGQYLMQSLDENPNRPLRNVVFYRQDYLDEFERIWETQARSNPLLTEEAKHEIRDIAIFYQRPLRSKKSLIAVCELDGRTVDVEQDGRKVTRTIGPKVCPKSSPLYQEFRIWQRLNDIVLEEKSTGRKVRLDDASRRRLARELDTRDRLSKAEVLKLLVAKPREWDMNFKEVVGNRTMSRLYAAFSEIVAMSGHGEHDFTKMAADDAQGLVNDVFAALGFNTDILHFDADGSSRVDDIPFYQLWHLLYSYEGDDSKTGDEALVRKLMQLCRFDNADYAKVLARVTFEDDYGSISARAIRRILPYMKDGNDYSTACALAGYNHSRRSLTREQLDARTYVDHLDTLKRGALRNPVVEKILNQMVNVVNAVIAEYGRPDEIRIEMARELKKTAQQREEMTEAIGKSTREQEEMRRVLTSEFGIANPSRNDLTRYRLYLELADNGFKTLYSQTYIPRERLFSKDFDIEHIIPQSRLFDDSFGNKTLEARQVNIDKGNQTALDFVKEQYGDAELAQYKSRVLALYSAGRISRTKRDRLLMSAGDIPEGFINRDINDTQYIARQAREMLEQVVPIVVATTGSVTSRLREDWGLIDAMKELNWEKYDALGLTERLTDRDGRPYTRIKDWTKRNDHRHHAMDALTIAFTKHAYIQYLNNLNAHSDKSGAVYATERTALERVDGHLRFKAPMPGFRAEALRHLEQILVSIKSKSKVATPSVNRSKAAGGAVNKKVELTPRGQLHNETIYGSSRYYETRLAPVNASMTADVIATVADRRQREALAARLEQYGGDARKAFTGRNSMDKNPIWLDAARTVAMPAKVKVATLATRYTIRKPVSPDLKVDKVIDTHVRQILEARLSRFGGDARKAFVNLDEDPIWLNEERGIAIKRVTITGRSEVEPLHVKHDHYGRDLRDAEGQVIPTDFVSTNNNHHVAIFRDANGNLQEHIVSFYEAMARKTVGLPVVDKEYNSAEGWQFQFTMKQNEYFVLPDLEHGFDPNEIDLLAPENYPIISKHLFRVQTLSSKDYRFRQHLETNVEEDNALRHITWERIRNLPALTGIVKVRVNHLGNIVAVGEY